MVPTCTILHTHIDVVGIIDVQDISKSVRNRIKSKKAIQRHPICLTDYYYDYILNGIELWDKIEFERSVSGNSDKE